MFVMAISYSWRKFFEDFYVSCLPMICSSTLKNYPYTFDLVVDHFSWFSINSQKISNILYILRNINYVYATVVYLSKYTYYYFYTLFPHTNKNFRETWIKR